MEHGISCYKSRCGLVEASPGGSRTADWQSVEGYSLVCIIVVWRKAHPQHAKTRESEAYPQRISLSEIESERIFDCMKAN